MFLYTIGFTKKSAEQFFTRIKYYNIKLLVDIRLNNNTQLAGFTKKNDLKYFLEQICGCQYEHCPEYAPTKELLSSYKHKKITWPEYEKEYTRLMQERGSIKNFISRFDSLCETVCLLCAEPQPDKCHRRLFAEMIAAELPDVILTHI